MTYVLPPLNALRAFEAAARHLSFKLAAQELHVTPGAIGQQVKALENRLGVRLFERLHKQLVLTEAAQAFLPEVGAGFRRLASATARLRPTGVQTVLTLGVHGRFELRRLALDQFRTVNPGIGLRVLQPAGLYELTEGKVDLLIDRGLGHHPRYRCDPLSRSPGLGDWLIAPVGTADCPEVTSFRAWLQQLPALVATSDRPPRLQIPMPIRQTPRVPRRLTGEPLTAPRRK
jgi:LysR family transcriptional regulator, glycine cleavage system transcriptional activator